MNYPKQLKLPFTMSLTFEGSIQGASQFLLPHLQT
jgi:hypothetical protein